MILSFVRFIPAKKRLGSLAILLAVQLAIPKHTAAHEFTVAIRAESAAALASSIRGMRLASTERDAHANETSDGHLGGLDLYILPQPSGVDHGIGWLERPGTGAPDVTVLMDGPEDLVDTDTAGAIVIGTGALPPDIVRDDSGVFPVGFAERYVAAYGQPPDLPAARSYNAARRIDMVVRQFGSVADRSAIVEGLAATRDGIQW